MGLYHRGLQLQNKSVQTPIVQTKVCRTDIDKLYHLIKISNSIALEQVTDLLKFPEDKVEEWTKILEKKGLIRIDYPPLGGVVYSVKVENE